MRKSGPPKGLISFLVLELLQEQPRYGYELLGEINDLSGGHWEPSYGSVYPILYKFEEKGLAQRIERDDEPDRKYFAITDSGREKLAEKRAAVGGKARDFADVILGFYHLYAALGTDDRYRVETHPEEWCFSETYSAWIVEQMIRHHERDFGEFERIDLTPEEFHAKYESEIGGDSDDEQDGESDEQDGESDEQGENEAA